MIFLLKVVYTKKIWFKGQVETLIWLPYSWFGVISGYPINLDPQTFTYLHPTIAHPIRMSSTFWGKLQARPRESGKSVNSCSWRFDSGDCDCEGRTVEKLLGRHHSFMIHARTDAPSTDEAFHWLYDKIDCWGPRTKLLDVVPSMILYSQNKTHTKITSPQVHNKHRWSPSSQLQTVKGTKVNYISSTIFIYFRAI